MLSEKEITFLRQKGIREYEDIDSYNIDSQVVTMKNGRKRQLTEIWTRVMGYMRPYENFNIGKKAEFEERKYFSEKLSLGYCSTRKK